MKLKTGRYYMVINDGLIEKWTHKYIVADIVVTGLHSYSYYAPVGFMRACEDSERVIIVDQFGDTYFFKHRQDITSPIDSDEFIFIKLSSIELSSLDIM